MATPLVLTIAKVVVQDNWQHTQRFRCTLTVGDGIYPVGGIPITAALAAALMPTTNNKNPVSVIATSLKGSGYIYDYIRATGCLMVMVVPTSASLTSATPLQQLNSDNFHGVSLDQIQLLVEYDRNAAA